jgi:hypothetical protein
MLSLENAVITVGSRIEPPEVQGLATGFANLEVLPKDESKESWHAWLKTLKNINAFARDCGLLLVADDVLSSIYGGQKGAYVEPISDWLKHIRNVRRLLGYHLTLSKRMEGYKPLIEVKEKKKSGEKKGLIQYGEPYGSKELGYKMRNILTADGENTNVIYKGNGQLNEETSLMWALAEGFKENLQGGIHVGFSIPPDAEGYWIVETKETPYLLAAIYYDLWETITEKRRVRRCPICGKFLKGNQKTCGTACRQAKSRKDRKERASRP